LPYTQTHKIQFFQQYTKKYAKNMYIAEMETPNRYTLQAEDLRTFITPRLPQSNKYWYGHILIFAGRNSMSGAAILASSAAITAGAGIVRVATVADNPNFRPEVIVHRLNNNYDLKTYGKLAKIVSKQIDTLVVGPGLGSKGPKQKEYIKRLFDEHPAHIFVVDADGIKFFKCTDNLNGNFVFTPHDGEFRRLIHNSEKTESERAELLAMLDDAQQRIELVEQIASDMNATILLKGSTTIISDGKTTYLNNYGNPGMATAGSGDVLSGIVGAFIGKNRNKHITNSSLVEITAMASLAHSLAGDYYAEHYGMETLTASDIIASLKYVI
jgi:NAD(P)H-hydrate epimerase